jgi:phenylalanine-4-hydroxylase
MFTTNYATIIISRGKSFMYINNSRGPKIHPLELHTLIHSSWRKQSKFIPTLWFLHAFTKLQKVTISVIMSVHLAFCPSA